MSTTISHPTDTDLTDAERAVYRALRRSPTHSVIVEWGRETRAAMALVRKGLTTWVGADELALARRR
jgi:hypothetical protein